MAIRLVTWPLLGVGQAAEPTLVPLAVLVLSVMLLVMMS
jgi:hypothetical protein